MVAESRASGLRNTLFMAIGPLPGKSELCANFPLRTTRSRVARLHSLADIEQFRLPGETSCRIARFL
jgi:hypothetical protein